VAGKKDKDSRAHGPAPARSGPARVESGIPRLDSILKGGFFRGGTYTLYGPPGAGKTIVANQLCFNHIARTGKTCVYVTVLAESHAKMLRHLGRLEFFDGSVDGTRLKYIAGYHSLRQDGLDGLLKLLRSTLVKEKPSILVIDGLESVEQAGTRRVDAKEFLHQLQAFTSMTDTTTLLCAVEQMGEMRRDENAMVDGVI